MQIHAATASPASRSPPARPSGGDGFPGRRCCSKSSRLTSSLAPNVIRGCSGSHGLHSRGSTPSSPASKSNPNRRNHQEGTRKFGKRKTFDHRGRRKLQLYFNLDMHSAYQQAGTHPCQPLGTPHLTVTHPLFNPILGARPRGPSVPTIKMGLLKTLYTMVRRFTMVQRLPIQFYSNPCAYSASGFRPTDARLLSTFSSSSIGDGFGFPFSKMN